MKKILYSGVVLLLIAFVVGMYFFTKKPDDVREQDAVERLTASELAMAFSDEEKANLRFNGKVIEVTGVITSVEITSTNATVFLQTEDPLTGITCNFYLEESGTIKDIQPQRTVAIKGLCTGKLMDVVLTQCSLVKHEN